MSFCPRCGAPRDAAMSFCIACGEHLPPVATLPATGAPSAPVGKTVAPWKVVLLTFVTLGIYVFYFWWRTSREVDAFAGSRAHPLVRIGALVGLLGLAATIIGISIVLAPTLQLLLEDPETPIPEFSTRELYLDEPLLLAGAVLTVGGHLLMYTGMWRAWSAMREDEVRRGTGALDPRIFLGILVAAILLQFIPFEFPGLDILSFVALVGTLWVLASWQAHLNDAWTAARAPAGTTLAAPGG